MKRCLRVFCSYTCVGLRKLYNIGNQTNPVYNRFYFSYNHSGSYDTSEVIIYRVVKLSFVVQ